MLISVLIMAVFTVGAAVLLFSAPGEGGGSASAGGGTVTQTPEDDVETVPTLTVEPSPSPTPSPELEEPTAPSIESVEIQFDGRRMRDDVSQPLGRDLPINIRVEPIDSERGIDISWNSTNTDIFEVVEVPGTNRLGAKIVPIAVGSATLTVTVGDVTSQSVLVRITR